MAGSDARDEKPRAPRMPNRVLRTIRENERHETRAQFAEALTRVALELGEKVYPDEKYIERLESGAISWPRPPYRNILAELCGRPIGELGFTPPILPVSDSGELAPGVNKELRDAIFASGMEVPQLARKVGVDPKTVQRWITKGRVPHANHRWKVCRILGREEFELWPDSNSEKARGGRGSDQTAIDAAFPGSDFKVASSPELSIFDPARAADRIWELARWSEETNTGEGALSYLDSAAFQLAHDCLTVSPIRSGERAEAIANNISEALRTGRQRLAQTRDLYVIAGKVCAILSWISSDLGELSAADAHIRNGWMFADQSNYNPLRALLLSAQSKNEFWRQRHVIAVTYARRGFELNPPGTLRVLLACQEADALQAMGRIEDAREALIRSERVQDSIPQGDELGGIFACGVARQANYSIATYLRSGSPDQALRHVERAEASWRNGEDWAYGTWAQVQIGATMAHLANGDIEAAAITLQGLLEKPAGQRLATVSTRLHRDVTPLLENPAIERSKFATMLRERIADYDQPPTRLLPMGGKP